MTLFHENFLDVQEEDVRVDALLNLKVGPPEEPEEDEDLEYSDDDLGENTEITPLGDDIDEDDINSLAIPPDDDDDLLSDDDDDDWDAETEPYPEEDEIVDITTSQQNDPDDDDDDDDLLSDDDDDDFEIDEDFSDDDLDDDDTIDDVATPETSETDAPQMLDHPDAGINSRRENPKAGRMIDHEPGLPNEGAGI